MPYVLTLCLYNTTAVVCFSFQASKRDSLRSYVDNADNYGGVSLIKFTCLSVFRVVRVRIGDGWINQLIGHNNQIPVERCSRLELKIGAAPVR